MRRRYRSFISWVRAWLYLLPLALAGCGAPLVHQQRLAALHTAAARTCKTTHLTCAALAPCSAAIRTAISDWQSVSAASSKADAEAEAAALIIAGTSEIGALAICKGVK